MRTRAPRNPPGRLLTVIDLARSADVPDHVVRFYARTGSHTTTWYLPIQVLVQGQVLVQALVEEQVQGHQVV